MMKFSLLLALLFLLNFSLEAQLLWKISGNGLKENSYLYGTIHVMPKEKFSISSKIQQALNSSQTMAMEVDLNMDFKTKIQVAQEMIIPGGKTLEDLLNASDFKLVKSYCLDSLHMKKGKFKRYIRLKPFFFSAIVAQEQMGKTASYEMEFNKIAKKRKIPTLGLESIQFQMQTINKMKVEDQAKMMMQEFGSNPEEQFDTMLNLYLKEDLSGLYELIVLETSQIPEFNYNFLELRNSNWITVIQKQIALQSTFIAVGAAHLPGKTGVIELLKAQGFTVEPIN
jgi:uncharacterized protein YbaP (TraB family)